LSFFQQGTQPAAVLPSTTIGYVSLDLDPSGGQKIDAFRTLNKFPAFKSQVGVSSVDDLRHKIGDAIVSRSGCSGLSYSSDIDPWLGDRLAAAVVPFAGRPEVVGVLQVTDESQAKAGLTKINDCSHGHPAGFVVHDGWAIVAKSQEVADEVSAAASHSTLADDSSYQKWTKAVGEAGVVNAYASPDAGRVLADQLGGFLDPFASPGVAFSSAVTSAGASSAYHSTATAGEDPFSQALSGFKGGAATLRFTGDGVELVVAGDGSSPRLADLTGTTGGQLVQRLPADTAAALGVTLKPGWLSRELDSVGGSVPGFSRADAERELSQLTGLTVPDDIETLLGSGAAISVSKDLDLEAAENSADGSGVPVAATIKGDPAAIGQVLDKIRAKTGDLPLLGSDSSQDLVVLGPSPDYRKQVLAGGDLGDDATFTGVVPDAGDASSVLYVDMDALQQAIAQAGAGDQETLANLAPLRAIGFSAWTDEGVARFSLEISTD
jgi:hypothetical protein